MARSTPTARTLDPSLDATERSLVRLRWVGVLFALLEVWIETESARPLGFALAAVLAVANVAISVATGQVRSVAAQRRLGLAALALDVGTLLGYTYLYAFQQYGSTWLILYLAPLEAAWRYCFRGALLAAAAVSLLYVPRELYREAVFGYPFSPTSVIFRLGVMWIVALFAGFTVLSLQRERDEARALANRLQEAERAKADFLSVVSHELRTPLATVTGFAELLRARWRRLEPSTAESYLDEMLLAGKRLTHQIEALLDFASLDGAPLALQRRPVEVGCVAREALDLHAAAADSSGVFLARELEDGVFVDADTARLRAALGHLLDNAIKFSPRGATVTVRSYARGDTAVLEVLDRGIGIEREKLEMIFEPFTQAEMGDLRTHGGQGLGLALARRLVEAHEGRIDVESTPGVGSTFRVTLPVHRDPHGGDKDLESGAPRSEVSPRAGA